MCSRPSSETGAFCRWRWTVRELDRDFQADFIRSAGGQDDIVRDKLVAFVGAYNEAVCDIFATRNDNAYAFHMEEVQLVQVVKASDGFFVAYHPYHESFRGSTGVLIRDASTYDLNTVCQWLTAHMLKVRYPELGKPYEPPTPVPDTAMEEEVLSGGFGIMLHPDIRAYLKSVASVGPATSPFPGVQAAPFVRYEQGIAVQVVPWRFKLWSPVVDVPGLGRRRLYHWTHADIWWHPDRLNLDPAQARHLAQADILAFDAVLRTVPVFSQEEAEQYAARCAETATQPPPVAAMVRAKEGEPISIPPLGPQSARTFTVEEQKRIVTALDFELPFALEGLEGRLPLTVVLGEDVPGDVEE